MTESRPTPHCERPIANGALKVAAVISEQRCRFFRLLSQSRAAATDWLIQTTSFSGLKRIAVTFARSNVRLGFELFLAVSLSVAYYFLVRSYAAGVTSNSTNYWVFTSCSLSNFHLGQLYEVWKGRLAGLFLSGSLFDSLVQNNSVNPERYATAFGLYQAAWLLLLFLLIIYSLEKSLLINLGIFAGLMYNFSPVSGMYFYPWDLPAAVFFTLAVLLYEREQILWAAAVTCAGCFFKETVLVAALLCLLSKRGTRKFRLVQFLGIVAFYVWGKKLALTLLQVNGAVFSMGDATNVRGLLRTDIALDNLRTLFSPTLNHVVFANAGTLTIVLLLCWRRRFHPYTLLILAFVAGNFVYGAFTEFRVFMQVLPLSWMLLAGLWVSPKISIASRGSQESGFGIEPGIRSPGEGAGRPVPWGRRGATVGLVLLGAFLVLTTVGFLGFRLHAVVKNQNPMRRAEALSELQKRAKRGDASAELELGMRYLKGDGFAANPSQAVVWIRRAAEQGDPAAECQLGFLYATGEHLAQDYTAGFEWLHKAALQGNSEAQYGLGCFFEKGLGTERDTTEAALWYQRAAEQGHARAQLNLGLLLCVVRHEYVQARDWLLKSAEQGNTEAQFAVGKLYRGVPGLKPSPVDAYKWLKLAQLQRVNGAEEELRSCAVSMSRSEIEQAESFVREKIGRQ